MSNWQALLRKIFVETMKYDPQEKKNKKKAFGNSEWALVISHVTLETTEPVHQPSTHYILITKLHTFTFTHTSSKRCSHVQSLDHKDGWIPD